MRTMQFAIAAFMLFGTVIPLYAGWGEWEKAVLACDDDYSEIGVGKTFTRYFQASADYTCFSNSEFPNVPIIPERFSDPTDDDYPIKYRINRIFYQGDETQADVDYTEIVINPLTTHQSAAIPILSTCSYIDGGTEYCVGLILRYVVDVDYNYTWKIIVKAVDIPADPENEMTWIGDESSIDSADGPIVSADAAGDNSGNIHLVTAETSHNYFGNQGRNPDWTTNLYYSRWNAQEQDWDIDHYLLPSTAVTGCIMRNPDVACDSQGNVHVVFTYNDNAASSDYGIGYCKIVFNQLRQISNVTTDIIAQDGTGLMCESPDITVDDLNSPHVVFQRSGNATDWRVYYSTKSGMGLWNAPTQVPPPQGTYYYYWEPSITYCHNYIHVVYAGAIPSGDETFTTSNDRIYYTRRSLTGMLFENPVEMSDDGHYNQNYDWDAIFKGNPIDTTQGYANMNRFPCVIAGDDEVSVIWVGINYGYMGPTAILARRCSWEDE